MKRAAALLFALAQAAAWAQPADPGLKLRMSEVELGATRENLSKGLPDWRSLYLEGAHYIAEIGEVKSRKGYQWANVTATTGELFLADMQCLKLLEQVAQERAPVVLTVEKTSKGFSKIVEAHRYTAEPVAPAATEPASSF